MLLSAALRISLAAGGLEDDHEAGSQLKELADDLIREQRQEGEPPSD